MNTSFAGLTFLLEDSWGDPENHRARHYLTLNPVLNTDDYSSGLPLGERIICLYYFSRWLFLVNTVLIWVAICSWTLASDVESVEFSMVSPQFSCCGFLLTSHLIYDVNRLVFVKRWGNSYSCSKHEIRQTKHLSCLIRAWSNLPSSLLVKF